MDRRRARSRSRRTGRPPRGSARAPRRAAARRRGRARARRPCSTSPAGRRCRTPPRRCRRSASSAPSSRARSRSAASAPTNGDEVVLRRGRADEPERVGVRRAARGSRSSRLTDVLHARRSPAARPSSGPRRRRCRRPVRPIRKGERGGGTRERRLARVEPAEEHDGAGVPRGSIDELLVLVHRRSLRRSRRSRASCGCARSR